MDDEFDNEHYYGVWGHEKPL